MRCEGVLSVGQEWGDSGGSGGSRTDEGRISQNVCTVTRKAEEAGHAIKIEGCGDSASQIHRTMAL